MTIVDKLQKRAVLIADARKVLDGGDMTTYENMQKDIDNLGVEIEAYRKQEALEESLKVVDERATTTKATENKASVSDIFFNGVRHNDMSAYKALSTSPDTAGGFLQAPATLETMIKEIMMANVAMRGISNVISSSTDRKVPVVTSFGAATWVDEDGAIGVTDDTVGNVTLGNYKVGKIVKVSLELLADSAFSIEKFLAGSFARVIGEAEETAFVTGNGSGKPSGVMNGVTVGFTTTVSATAISGDDLLDLFYSLKVGYRKNATFLMSDVTEKLLRKLKNGTTGDYAWQPGLTLNQPNTLLGRPVKISDAMATAASTTEPICFGDFSNYMIKDTSGMTIQVLREKYADNGQIGFLGLMRTDGARVLDEAFKSLKMKT